MVDENNFDKFFIDEINININPSTRQLVYRFFVWLRKYFLEFFHTICMYRKGLFNSFWLLLSSWTSVSIKGKNQRSVPHFKVNYTITLAFLYIECGQLSVKSCTLLERKCFSNYLRGRRVQLAFVYIMQKLFAIVIFQSQHCVT